MIVNLYYNSCQFSRKVQQQWMFEKATDEATWSEMYARLCRKMMEQISTNIQDEGIRMVNSSESIFLINVKKISSMGG